MSAEQAERSPQVRPAAYDSEFEVDYDSDGSTSDTCPDERIDIDEAKPPRRATKFVRVSSAAQAVQALCTAEEW